VNRIVVFALGIAVGIAATLALQPDGDRPEPTEPQAERVTEVRTATAEVPVRQTRDEPQPIIARGPTPSEPQAPSSLQDALFAANGDVESVVVDGDMYVGGRAEQFLSGDEFSHLVGALLRTSSADAAEHYQKVYDEYQQLPSVLSGEIRVESLACGRRVCAVNLIGYDAASVKQVWTELTGAPVAMSPIMRNDTGLEISMGTGRFIGSKVVETPYGHERRLLITVDPSVRSATTGFNEFRPPSGG
jgi:hypothetical protein